MTLESTLLERIKQGQKEDPELIGHKESVESGKKLDFSITTDGVIRFQGRLCVPNDKSIKEEILTKEHNTPYSVHPDTTKMYNDLKILYWWPGMKKDIFKFVERCLTCQQIKAEHKRLPRELQPLQLPEWKWGEITMDFVVGLPITVSHQDAIWVIVDRFSKVAHFILIFMTYSMDKLAVLYIKEIVRLHGVSVSIVSDSIR